MKKITSTWLIVVVAVLLIGLLINQVIYAFNAADDQEKALNEKVEIALDVIVDKVSENQSVCKSVDKCLYKENKPLCCKYLGDEEEWKIVDSIIKSELAHFKIDLNYNFDFAKNQPDNKNAYAMHMDKVFAENGVVMYLEFPDRSAYLMRQMGPVFISSVLLILFITVAFYIMYRYYKREKQLVMRTRDFINNMTHEFKTPLANISFATNMIGRENDNLKSEKITRYAAIIQAENQRLVDNCEDLLVIGSAESDLGDVLNDKLDVHEVIQNVLARYKALQENLNVEWTEDYRATSTEVLSKKSFLDNVISNLIDNAIKYTEEIPKIKVETYNDANKIIVSITDNGIGIYKEVQDVIFDKFYRVNNQDQHDVKGFGLGLSYVKMVVEQMKGSVSVKSEIGKGSTFIIKLPLVNG